MRSGKLLKRNGGGDRTRTCMPFRAAVFKTAALPIMRPLRRNPEETISQAVGCLNLLSLSCAGLWFKD
jgi:hypothetical protein